jgi:hypothetical protein
MAGIWERANLKGLHTAFGVREKLLLARDLRMAGILGAIACREYQREQR